MYSLEKNMNPGPVQEQLQVTYSIHNSVMYYKSLSLLSVQGLTQIEEMLVSAVLPIMTLYRLPHSQYGYSGHVINPPQDAAAFANCLPCLPSDLDVIVIRRKELPNLTVTSA